VGNALPTDRRARGFASARGCYFCAIAAEMTDVRRSRDARVTAHD